MVMNYLFGLCALVYFVVLVVCMRAIRNSPPRRLKELLSAIAGVAMVFVLGGLQQMAGVMGGFNVGSQLLVGSYTLAATLVFVVVGIRSLGALQRAADVAVAQLERPPGRPPPIAVGLTPREVEVVAAIHRGLLSNEEIAEALIVSNATAATHVRNVLRKARLKSRRELILLELPKVGSP